MAALSSVLLGLGRFGRPLGGYLIPRSRSGVTAASCGRRCRRGYEERTLRLVARSRRRAKCALGNCAPGCLRAAFNYENRCIELIVAAYHIPSAFGIPPWGRPSYCRRTATDSHSAALDRGSLLTADNLRRQSSVVVRIRGQAGNSACNSACTSQSKSEKRGRSFVGMKVRFAKVAGVKGATVAETIHSASLVPSPRMEGRKSHPTRWPFWTS